jgi:hypothetical protein
VPATGLHVHDEVIARGIGGLQLGEPLTHAPRQADAIEHGVALADVDPESDVPHVLGRRSVERLGRGHAAGRGEAIGAIAGEADRSVAALRDAHQVHAIGIDLAEQEALRDQLLEGLLVVIEVPATLAIVGHAGNEIEARRLVDALEQGLLGLPLAAVHLPRVRTLGLGVATAAVQAEEERPAPRWLLALAEQHVGHRVRADLQDRGLERLLQVVGLERRQRVRAALRGAGSASGPELR